MCFPWSINPLANYLVQLGSFILQSGQSKLVNDIQSIMSHKQQSVSRGWNQQRKRIKLEQVGQDYNAFLQAYESKSIAVVLSILDFHHLTIIIICLVWSCWCTPHTLHITLLNSSICQMEIDIPFDHHAPTKLFIVVGSISWHSNYMIRISGRERLSNRQPPGVLVTNTLYSSLCMLILVLLIYIVAIILIDGRLQSKIEYFLYQSHIFYLVNSFVWP